MSGFEVIVLGVGDTFSEVNHTTALLLVCDGFHLAVDCPDRYRAVLRNAAIRAGRTLFLSDIDHMIITHVHGDHMNGLEGVAFYKHFYDRRRLRLLTVPEVGAVIWDERLKASMGTLWDGHQLRAMHREDYFDDVPLSWTGGISVGPFRIRARRTQHHVPTAALRIEAAGRVLGFSSDTAFDPGPADLIIHETNYGPAHTPYSALAALPGSTRARMRLIHYPDAFDVAGSVIPVLQEGEVLWV